MYARGIPAGVLGIPLLGRFVWNDCEGPQPNREWLKAQGPISSFQLVGEQSDKAQAELHYRARATERIFTFTFVLDKDGKIANMSLAS
jgi:hypothetical protein